MGSQARPVPEPGDPGVGMVEPAHLPGQPGDVGAPAPGRGTGQVQLAGASIAAPLTSAGVMAPLRVACNGRRDAEQGASHGVGTVSSV